LPNAALTSKYFHHTHTTQQVQSVKKCCIENEARVQNANRHALELMENTATLFYLVQMSLTVVVMVYMPKED